MSDDGENTRGNDEGLGSVADASEQELRQAALLAEVVDGGYAPGWGVEEAADLMGEREVVSLLAGVGEAEDVVVSQAWEAIQARSKTRPRRVGPSSRGLRVALAAALVGAIGGLLVWSQGGGRVIEPVPQILRSRAVQALGRDASTHAQRVARLDALQSLADAERRQLVARISQQARARLDTDDKSVRSAVVERPPVIRKFSGCIALRAPKAVSEDPANAVSFLDPTRSTPTLAATPASHLPARAPRRLLTSGGSRDGS